MRLSLASPLSALWKAALLMGLVYAVSVPGLAPLRPEVIDVPLTRYHDAVNQVVRDSRPDLSVLTDPLRLAPKELRRRFDGALGR